MLLPLSTESPRLSFLLDVIDKLTKILALVIGAGWAYVNYVRGRTFSKRLEPKIAGKWVQREGRSLLSGSAQIKNVGLSKFPIRQKGTAILVFDLLPSAPVEKPTDAVEERVRVREVFKQHAWIEPGETVEENFLLQLPDTSSRLAIKLELRVVAADIEWNANSIVGPEEKALTGEIPEVAARIHHETRSPGGNMAEKSFPNSREPGDWNSQGPERPDVTIEIEKEKDKTRETDPKPREQPVRK